MFEHLNKYAGEVKEGDVFIGEHDMWGYTIYIKIVSASRSVKDQWKAEILGLENIPEDMEVLASYIGTKIDIGRNGLFTMRKVKEKEPTAEEIHDLINAALDTNDKEWFQELTKQLKEAEEKQHDTTRI